MATQHTKDHPLIDKINKHLSPNDNIIVTEFSRVVKHKMNES